MENKETVTIVKDSIKRKNKEQFYEKNRDLIASVFHELNLFENHDLWANFISSYYDTISTFELTKDDILLMIDNF